MKKIFLAFAAGDLFTRITHDIILNRGVISQIGTPEEIVTAPANNYVQNFVVDNLRMKIDSLRRFVS